MLPKILFLDLCNTFERISKTTKRLEIQAILTQFLSNSIKNDPDSLPAILYLCNATVFPEYHNRELGIGEQIIQNTVTEATGLSLKTVKQMYIKTGDLGTIAMENRVNQLFIVKKQLTVVEVFEQLKKIARETGKNSINTKKNFMLSLMNLCSPLETKYLIRLFECQLKIGLALQTILISLSRCFDECFDECDDQRCDGGCDDQRCDGECDRDRNIIDHTHHNNDNDNVYKIKEAYSKRPEFEYLCKILLENGINNLHAKVIPGIPVKPMLAQPSNNLTKAFSKVENVTFISEFKYDGERAQIHHFNGKTKIFSRNSEEITLKYPDLASLKISDRPFILDGEIVAFGEGEILPFQTLSTRKRTKVDKIEVQVCVFVFDILFFDGEELLNLPLSARREILFNNFREIDGKLKFGDSLTCSSVEDIDAHFKRAIQSKCEGVMLKILSSAYKPSQRSNHWIKLKQDYLDSLGDSLDLVVIGAFYGKGKRTGNFGGFLLAVYNDMEDKFEACCKIGTGFSDDELRAFYEQLSPLITTSTSRIVYNERGVKPDVWIDPKYVWEVKAASLSQSPIYSAGSQERGISLRFPRFIRERLDKSVEQATTSNEIVRMYLENKEDVSEEDEFN